MNVEIGAEAALFPEKEYISGIFVAVHEANNSAKSGVLRLPVCKCMYSYRRPIPTSTVGWVGD